MHSVTDKKRDPNPAAQTTTDGKSVALVLGSGGARGLAHIGVIRELQARGHRIESISGSSIGALVGGVHAMGALDTYIDWVSKLRQTDVLRLLDWNLSGGGLIRGDRIIEQLRDLLGDCNIEDLPITFTAVAVDIDRGREVWMNRGPLFDAVRASIAIPGVFTPHQYLGRTLVDGGILNPVPVAPTVSSPTEFTVVVDANAPSSPDIATGSATKRQGSSAKGASDSSSLPGIERIRNLIDNLSGSRDAPLESPPGISAILTRSLETMQAAITRQHLAVFRPDILINIPKNVCMVHEFHRATELIEFGEEMTRKAFATQSWDETTGVGHE